jgi:hypothetical protein
LVGYYDTMGTMVAMGQNRTISFLCLFQRIGFDGKNEVRQHQQQQIKKEDRSSEPRGKSRSKTRAEKARNMELVGRGCMDLNDGPGVGRE